MLTISRNRDVILRPSAHHIFICIGPPAAELSRLADFQDNNSAGAILFLVS